MGAEDRNHGKGQDRELIAMPYLFGDQQHHPAAKEQYGQDAAVVVTEPMPEGRGADDKRQSDHPVFEPGVVDDVDTEDGQGCHQDREQCAVNGAEQRCCDTERIQIQFGGHAANLRLLQLSCKKSLTEQC